MSDHTVPRIKLVSKPSMAELTLGVYNGTASITIYSAKPQGEGTSEQLYKKNLGLGDIVMLRDTLASLDSIPPGNQKAFTSSSFIDDKYTKDSTLCIGTDENGVKYLEVQFRDKNKTPHMLRFVLSVTGVFSDSSKDFNYGDKTKSDVKGIVWWIDHVLPVSMYHTNGTVPRPKGNYPPRGGGGGNNNRVNNSFVA